MSLAKDFERADSRNLPDMDMAIIMEYFKTSDKHNIAEVRGVKALMAARSGYVQSAVGYVELKRNDTTCTVRAKVVPEHKVTKKYYLVTVNINEADNTVIDTACDGDGCPAREGGCKHTLVVLFWLEKKSSEPSPTSTECYWKKPRLASEPTQPMLAKSIVKPIKRQREIGPSNPENLNKFYEECKKRKIGNSLILSVSPDHDAGLTKYCLFDMILQFTITYNGLSHDYETFKEKMSKTLTDDIKRLIEKETKTQADSKLWHSIRQGRITASKVYEASHCTTNDGALVEQILGGHKFIETKAMKRGKLLEKAVVAQVEKSLKCKITECGFYIINCMSGASPDGKANDFIIEIKCPSKTKTVETYIKNNIVQEKFRAQCQMQMLATGYKKCAFCVADPKFETNNKVEISWLYFDSAYASTLLAKAEVFWKTAIFPKILKNAVLVKNEIR